MGLREAPFCGQGGGRHRRAGENHPRLVDIVVDVEVRRKKFSEPLVRAFRHRYKSRCHQARGRHVGGQLL